MKDHGAESTEIDAIGELGLPSYIFKSLSTNEKNLNPRRRLQ